MVEKLFVWLTQAIGQSPLLGLGAALVWGVLSVLLSPCHLAGIPLIVGFISQQREELTTRRAFVVSLAFSLGILVTIGVIGVITTTLGRMMGDIGRWGDFLVAAVFVVVGLYLLGVFKFDLPGMGRARTFGRGVWAAFILGLLFGIALGPCTFAYMAPILAVVLAASSDSLTYGIPLMLMYGIGHCGVIVFAGTFTRVIENYLRWNEQSRTLGRIKKVCGLLLLIGAVYMVLK